MAVRLRLKKMGRRHRPFFRICAMDGRRPRDGKVIEELGSYDPMVKETDARAILNGERINYWLSVGAQPSDNVRVLIKKYGLNGSHLEQQRQAMDRLKIRPAAPPPTPVARPEPDEPVPQSATAPESTAPESTAPESTAPESAPDESAAEDKVEGATEAAPVDTSTEGSASEDKPDQPTE